MNEDNELRQLLSQFNPRQGSEVEFMARLQRQMDAIDTVREYCQAERRRNRRAVIVATAAGCLTGIALTLLMLLMITHDPSTLNFMFGWICVAGASIAVTLASFRLVQILMSPPKLQLNKKIIKAQSS